MAAVKRGERTAACIISSFNYTSIAALLDDMKVLFRLIIAQTYLDHMIQVVLKTLLTKFACLSPCIRTVKIIGEPLIKSIIINSNLVHHIR